MRWTFWQYAFSWSVELVPWQDCWLGRALLPTAAPLPTVAMARAVVKRLVFMVAWILSSLLRVFSGSAPNM
jgi:hypothetical protein